MRWNVVGSGPSGQEVARESIADGRTVVINTAIRWVPLDLVEFYFFRQARQWELFPELGRRGIKLVTFERPKNDWPPYRRPDDKNPPWVADLELLHPSDQPVDRPVKWLRGTYSPYRDPVGPQAVQYCINNGASEVRIWGMEGGGNADAWKYHGQLLQAVADACPDVRLVVHGRTHYTLQGPKVEMIGCAQR